MKRALWWVPFVLTPALAGDVVGPVRYEAGAVVAQLESQEIDESSGMVAGGPANPGIFFTHNDSGDAPRFFAFDTSGKHRGVWTLAGVQAVDWEEMTAWTDAEGQRWLMLCDTGDNNRRRDHLLLHVVREPEVGAEAKKSAVNSFTSASIARL